MVSEKPYENENREKKYIEGQVKVGNGGGITGVFDLPEWAAMCKLHGDIVFMGYHNQVTRKVQKGTYEIL